jgi:tRNA uridine 5-carboxymethylaminomethyl modification enzyme
LRADNADRRLTGFGAEQGIIGPERRKHFADKLVRLEAAGRRLSELTLTPNAARAAGIAVRMDGGRRNGHQLLSLPDVTMAQLVRPWPEVATLEPDIIEQLENDAQYSVYLERQETDIAAFRRDEALGLPADLDYAQVRGLSTEAMLKLNALRPATLGQASRIDGVTPAALTLVLAHARRNTRHHLSSPACGGGGKNVT